MRCSDPLLHALNGLGYNVVRLPSARFTPLVLLESDRRRRTTVIGPVERELPALDAGERPVVHRDDPAPNLAVRSTRRTSGSLLVDFLEPLLAAMGATASAHAALERSGGMSIVLEKVRRDWVSVGDLARYLESGVGAGSRHVANAAELGHLYIVTAVLKSAVLTTQVERSIAQKLGASASATSALKVDVKQEVDVANEATISFTGRTPLAFAFQAVRLIYDGEVYLDYATAQGLIGFALPGSDQYPKEGALLVDDDLVEVD